MNGNYFLNYINILKKWQNLMFLSMLLCLTNKMQQALMEILFNLILNSLINLASKLNMFRMIKNNNFILQNYQFVFIYQKRLRKNF